MTTVHARFAVSVILYMAIVAGWGIVSYFRKTGMSGSYRGTLVIGELMLITQGIFGVLLVGSGYRPAQSLHFLYGGLSLFVLPVLMTYVRFKPKNQVPLVYGLGALFITGLAIRALMTGA
jgi:heme A synthase